MSSGIVIYGPPASGKDTLTAALMELEPSFVQFARLKAGGGRTRGYRMVTHEQLHDLERAGGVIYRNDRYGNVYVIDRPSLDALFVAGRTPVVHLGQIAGIEALTNEYVADWLRVHLQCSREVSRQRSVLRGDADTAARLNAWDATAADLCRNPDYRWDLALRTDQLSVAEAAQAVIKAHGSGR